MTRSRVPARPMKAAVDDRPRIGDHRGAFREDLRLAGIDRCRQIDPGEVVEAMRRVEPREQDASPVHARLSSEKGSVSRLNR